MAAVRSLLIASAFLCTFNSVGAEFPPQFSDAGLKLVLTVTNEVVGGEDVHDIQIELINEGSLPAHFEDSWEADLHSRRGVKGMMYEYSSFTANPPIKEGQIYLTPGFQSNWHAKKLGYAEETIEPGDKRTITLQCKGPKLVWEKVTEPGQYEIRAHFNGLTSNPQTYIVGGSKAPPRPTVAKILAYEKADKTFTISLGADDGFGVGTLLQTIGMSANGWALRVIRADAHHSTVELTAPPRDAQQHEDLYRSLVGAYVVKRTAEVLAAPELSGALNSHDLVKARQILDAHPGVTLVGDAFGHSALYNAVDRGDVEAVRLMLDHGTPVDASENVGGTALHHAATKGNLAIATLLLDRGADVNAKRTEWWEDKGDTPLQWAAKHGHREMAELLLKRGASAKAASESGVTALHCAAQYEHVEIMKLLIDAGADIRALTKTGMTPLHFAAMSGKQSALELLIAHGAEINARDADGHSPLYFATRRHAIYNAPSAFGNQVCAVAADPIDYLLTKGAQWDVWSAARLDKLDTLKTLLATPHIPPAEAETKEMLTWAVQEEHAGVLEILLAAKLDTEQRDRYGRTALHWAARLGNPKMLELLLKAGASPNSADEIDASTPLHLAALFGHEGAALQLLEAGADVNDATTKHHTPLHIAARNGNLGVAKVLLEHGANANARNLLGQSALTAALHAGQEADMMDDERCEDTVDVLEGGYFPGSKNNRAVADKEKSKQALSLALVQMLLEHGADASTRDKNGQTPLHRAVNSGDIESARVLLEHGADANAADAEGRTPIFYALGGRELGARGRLHIFEQYTPSDAMAFLELLIKSGAREDVKDNNGNTLLHRAVEQRGKDTVALLLERGADANARNALGQTPLHEAAESEFAQAVKLLLDHKSELEAHDASGRTPLHHAVSAASWDGYTIESNKGLATVRVLLERGADLTATDTFGRTPVQLLEKRIEWASTDQWKYQLPLLNEMKKLLSAGAVKELKKESKD